MAAPLFDYATGQWVDVPDHEVTQKVASGKFGFQQGMEIPVIDPNGGVGSIPAEKARQAFAEGFRWQTHEDATAYAAREEERLQQERLNDDLAAGAAGVLRGATLGGSDIALGAIGESLGYGNEFTENLQGLKEVNPVSSAVGSVAGTLANPLTRLAGEAAFAGGANAAARVMPSTANGILAQIAKTGTGSAIEGAFYGLGEGISEAALGDPNEVVENLFAGPAMGALFGGAFGAGFGGAQATVPFFSKLSTKLNDTFDDLVQGAAQKGAKAVVLPPLVAKGDKEAARIASQIIDSPAMRQAYEEGGEDAVRLALREQASAQDELVRQARELKSGLNEYVKGMPKKLQSQIDDDLAAASGDLQETLKMQYARHQALEDEFVQSLKERNNPGQIIGMLNDEVTNTVKALEKIGDPRAKLIAGDIDNYLQAQVRSRSQGALDMPLEMRVGDGAEMLIGREIRNRLPKGAALNKYSEEARGIIKKLDDNVNYLLQQHPSYGVWQKELDDAYKSFDAVRSYASGVSKVPDTNVKLSVLRKMVADPEKSSQFNTLLNNFGEYAPEIAAFKKAANDVVGQNNALMSLRQKLAETANNRLSSSLTVDDIEDIVKTFDASPEKILDSAEKLRQISRELSEQADVGPISKYLRLQKALGKPVNKELEALAEHEKGFDLLKKFAPDGDGENQLRQLMSIITKKGAQASAGALIGGYVGDAPGAAAGAMLGMSLNPAQAFRTLTKLEKASNASFKTLEKTTQKALQALVSKPVRQAGTAASALDQKPLKERRKDYRARAEFLNNMRDPTYAADVAERRLGTLEGAPQIKSMATAHLMRQAEFLGNKMPVDPMAHKTIFANKSTWEPSDFELARFERYVDAVENPNGVIENIANGKVSPEEVEAVKTLYPQIFSRLQTQVLDAIMEDDVNLSYQQRMLIGTLFEVPTDVSLDPQFIVAMQQNFAPEQAGRPEGSLSAPSPKPARLDLDPSAMQTEAQRTTYS